MRAMTSRATGKALEIRLTHAAADDAFRLHESLSYLGETPAVALWKDMVQDMAFGLRKAAEALEKSA